MCNSARGMMFAVGCIQALRCNTNECPTGVATQKEELVFGLDVQDKSKRVANFHEETVKAFYEVISAAGLKHPKDLKPWNIMRRISPLEIKNYSEIYPFIEPGSLLGKDLPEAYARPWSSAKAEAFT